MAEVIAGNEPIIRLGVFAAVFAIMALWEVVAPRRRRTLPRSRRWPANLAIVVLDVLLVRVVAPTAAVGFALTVEARGFGLTHALDLPGWLAVALCVVLLDLAIYLQHVVFHAVPALWRLHRMHHADLEFDVTTGARFHPIEILLSLGIKFAAIAALGAPALAVIVFEVLLNATSMFNHSNVRMPASVDAVARLFVVTPDMHRVHHSVEFDEANSNFGFNLPWWDRLLGTYAAQPRGGHEGMTIGLRTLRDTRACTTLVGMLLIPFTSTEVPYGINRPTGR